MKVYEIITNKILKQLEEGTVPWQKPWRTTLPRNFVSKNYYRGINLLMLSGSEFSCPYWATFRQIKKAGGSVNKGEKAEPVIYWNWVPASKTRSVKVEKGEEKPEVELSERMMPFLRYYNVFNLEQTTGIEIPGEEKTDIEPIMACENIMSQMPGPPAVTFNGGSRAFYRPRTDSVHLPRPSSFNSAEEYYSTLFHELVHSTGHQKRLSRSGIEEPSSFGSEKYSKEELVAEIGAAFLCGIARIENRTIDNSSAYIQGWLKALADDKKLMVIAAAQAQKASDYICDSDKTGKEA
ncbi:MAG: DUF1738 domain-containing protein [Proteobacteria bacterium]|nr:DUF1738 domain-containing protein [Pseudomonadota bacterium]